MTARFAFDLARLNVIRRMLRRYWIPLLISVGLLGGSVVAIPVYAYAAEHHAIYTTGNAPNRSVAIVFGAGVNHDGTPTPYLVSRLLAAEKLYRSGKVRVLLLSGDNSTAHYNEPVGMKRYLVAHGIPAAKIVLDYAGYDTYDTCYRAHALFGVTQAVLVSHGYHLPRAILTCSSLGIASIGVTADRPEQTYSKLYLVRELFSLDKAAFQLLLRPKPAVLGKNEQGVYQALRA